MCSSACISLSFNPTCQYSPMSLHCYLLPFYIMRTRLAFFGICTYSSGNPILPLQIIQILLLDNTPSFIQSRQKKKNHSICEFGKSNELISHIKLKKQKPIINEAKVLGIRNTYMFTRNTQLLELEGASDKKLLEISDFGFKLWNVGLNPFPNSV